MLKVLLESTCAYVLKPEMGYGGTERVVLWLCGELAKLGVEVAVAAPVGSEIPGVEVIETVKADPKRPSWESEKEAFEKYKDRIGDFDLVHSHGDMHFPYMYKLDHPETRVLSTVHGIQVWRSPPPVPKPNLVALSRWHREDMKRRYGVECKVIGHGIPVEKFPFVENKDYDHGFVVSFGLFSKHKGHHLSVFLARKLGLSLVVAGKVADESYFDYIEKFGDEDVEVHPDVREEFKVELLSKARAVLLPFLADEAYSIIALEAMACGTPVVTTRRGAMPEIVKHGKTGFVCDSLEKETYKFSMEEALGKLGKIKPSRCREWVEKNFTSRIMAEKYLELYKDVMEGKCW